MVAYYVDGIYSWSPEELAMFPDAVKVSISAIGELTAMVGDVEPDCIWPPENAVDWVRRARADGYDPTIYVNETNHWGPCRQAFHDAGVPEPHWWTANYNGVRDVPDGAVARQFAHPGDGVADRPWETGAHYDLSIVVDYWPGVDGQPQKRSKDMTLVKGSGDEIYIVGAEGKRHIELAELEAHQAEGYAVHNIPQSGVDAIPDAITWNYFVPTTDEDDPAEFRPAHRVLARINEKVSSTTAVALTEADRADIAEKVRLGLLDDLAPLFDLAERLKN